MKLHLAAAALLVACTACQTPDYGRPLPEGWPALLKLKKGEQRPSFKDSWYDRDAILPAVERSIEWYGRPSSQQHFPKEGVTHARALRSVEHFRDLLKECASAEEFDGRLALEFDIYKSAGWNGKGGGVLFTGYCTPILDGALSEDATYRYPLYGLPDDLVKGKAGEILGQRQSDGSLAPYPTRSAIEAGGLLKGKQLELVWLRDPLDAFIAHVNGSAVIRLPSGEERRFGYSGKNGREYSSLGKLLVADRQISAQNLSLQAIRDWGARNPERLMEYMRRDDSFVFFLPIDGAPKGSLNVEVEPGRTLATDKALFPRGGVVFIDVDAPKKTRGTFAYDRFVLDQDTGGAIRTAGRADIYIGIGEEAEQIAGSTKYPGQMYYLFLREGAQP